MNATILMNASSPVEVSNSLGSLIGAYVIALLILGYLLYSLKPEKS